MTEAARLATDIKALVGTPAAPKTLPARPAAAPVKSNAGSARPPAPNTGGISTGSLIGDLTEADYTSRQWHPVQTITSSDGFFTFEQRHLKKLFLTDGAGQAHALILDDKP